MQDNHALWSEVMDAAGPKKLRDVTGYDISTLYSFARNPMDSHPDGTGARGILDRFEAVVDLLASRASSRVTLLKLESRTLTLFQHALDRGVSRPLSSTELKKRATGTRGTMPIKEGTRARFITGTASNWQWNDVKVLSVTDGKAWIEFDNSTRMKVDAARLVVVESAIAFDPSRIPSHSEAQFSPEMSDAAYTVAINNDDMMRSHCE